jgi:hypothetical protein
MLMIQALGIFAVTYLLMPKPRWPIAQLDRPTAGSLGAVLMIAAGLLWLGLVAHAGAIIGMPFSLEGFAFFTDATFPGHTARLTPAESTLPATGRCRTGNGAV